MKKIIISILVISVLVVLGIPFISGIIAEKIVKANILQINQIAEDTGKEITIAIQSYDRGIFSSTMEWRLSFGNLKRFYGMDDLLFIDNAKHGFTNVVSKTSLKKNQWFNTFVNEKLDGNNPLDITTTYKFSGEIDSQIDLKPFTFIQASETINIKPGHFKLFMEKGIKRIESDLVWSGCDVPGKITAQEVSLRSRMEKISTYVWDGKIAMGINKVCVEEGDEKFEHTNIMLETNMDYQPSENIVSIGMGYGADSFDIGQGLIEDVRIKINFNNIAATGYEAFMEQYGEVVQDVLKDIDESQDDPEKIKATFQSQLSDIGFSMIGVYEKLLKKDLELKISEVTAQLPIGKIQGKALLRLKKDMTMAQLLSIMMNPAAVLDIFSLTSNLKIPFELIGDNPSFLSPLYPGMKTGFFVRDGNILMHTSETKNGKLYLNKKEVILN